ncbi:hypothetical protein K491DRAFT_719881 [Lophiostoma macrostomum CBS 122681]|uniref:Xylanolytic transcriptional activator regulatory domain-containing protein n=1 Tax=Lophiostoma macrostomum CBS 122681 TaxID=1314788 RepID=A0A6A6SYT8_9PLEO|nr:hypothetical protein K491DRAFT_719881 [Lophiostoma macrostomum CBS 122681]
MRKFISSDIESFAQKRQRTHQACDDCRRRKRRCIHTSHPRAGRSTQSISRIDFPAHNCAADDRPVNTAPSGTNTTPDFSVAEESPATVHARRSQVEDYDTQSYQDSARTDGSTAVQGSQGHMFSTTTPNQDAHHTVRRFIGDLNPESVFCSAQETDSPAQREEIPEVVGTWLDEGQPAAQTDAHRVPEARSSSIFYTSASVVQSMLLSQLEKEVLSTVPPEPYLSQIVAFYKSEIHPLLPIIHPRAFCNGYEDHGSKILINQAMCLLASMNPRCRNFLWLGSENTQLSPDEFGRRMLSAMRCAIEIGTVNDKLVLVQALGPMCLFVKGTEGVEVSTQLCARLIQLIHTMGLHHQRTTGPADSYEVTAFCCAWALDRLNAAIHGRPVIIHERDIGRDLEKCFDAQQPIFRALLRIVAQLDKVIALYRPNADTSASRTLDGLTTFEEIVVGSGGLKLPPRFLDTLEVLYHTVRILSCRRVTQDGERQLDGHPRKQLAASMINAILAGETAGDLVLLPFVPYAMSLALSVSYERMRHSKVPTQRSRARTEFQASCAWLEQLGEYSYKASCMAALGKATLGEMERVFDILQGSRQGGCHTTREGSAMENLSPEMVEISENRAPETHQLYSNDGNRDTEIQNLDIFSMFDPDFGLQRVDDAFYRNLDLYM